MGEYWKNKKAILLKKRFEILNVGEKKIFAESCNKDLGVKKLTKILAKVKKDSCEKLVLEQRVIIFS